MADFQSNAVHTDGLGREIVCEDESPDGSWHIELFGPSQYCNFLYAYARWSQGGEWSFGLGRQPAKVEQISFRWDLPNGAWGIFIDGECWAIYAHRPALRMHSHRIHSRSGLHAMPYTGEEIRFICAKRRGQRKGTKGFIIEE